MQEPANKTHRRTLIEVALPLPEINDASAYDKMPGIGPHPKGIHQWWARLPLPTARAVLFASVVTDPADDPAWQDRSVEEQDLERERLFGIIRRMMGKKLHEHPEVYAEANAEMRKHCGGKLPTVLDPFSGGGSIPLEANRLGFQAEAADLNPVAVLLNKCNLEIAPRWAGQPPVNPRDRGTTDEHGLTRIGEGGRQGKGGGGQSGADSAAPASSTPSSNPCPSVSIRGSDFLFDREWRGTQGLAADVRYYGEVIRQRAIEKIGHLYPKVTLPKEHGGGEANVIAWIWARTVASPNPAARGKHVPLISTFWLSSKKGSMAWLEPVVDKAAGTYRFEVRTGTPRDRAAVSAGTKMGRGAKFRCILTDQPMSDEHIKDEGKRGRLGYSLLAVVAEGNRCRCYLPADDRHQRCASSGETPQDAPAYELAHDPRNIWCSGYGLERFDQLFSPRQLLAMVTLSELVKGGREELMRDAESTGITGETASQYASAVGVFLALGVDRTGDFNNSLCRWSPSNEKVMNLFGRQAIPMVWDFAEANTLGDSVGAWNTCIEYVADCVEVLGAGGKVSSIGRARQIDAATGAQDLDSIVVSTDPPYYDNIGYAALSDFFYVWLRRTIGALLPDLFATMLVPKMPELTASPERFDGSKERAKVHFESGFRATFTRLRERMDTRFPLTVYYAFKQSDERPSEAKGSSGNSGIDLTTGWETLLEALISSGFQITATWPVRASQKWRMVSMGSNALASYIVLACRPRSVDAPQIGRREFMAHLKRELPEALRHLQQGNVAPVDLAQASIGPGMAVFSRYARVVESSGDSLSIRTALGMINQMLDEVLTEQEGDFDPDTRWAIAWFDQNGFGEGEFGVAETLSKAKNTSVAGMVEAGILSSKSGNVRLLRPEELPEDWPACRAKARGAGRDPTTDKRLTAWEAVHHLVRVLEAGGESAAAELVTKLGSDSEAARELAYRLFTLCERRKRPTEALSYNALVQSWPEILRLAQEMNTERLTQPGLGI